ncbi:MAG TPA: carboxypeptidase regulatory-like domain-containing protein, partial [Nannocystis sp.]
AEADGTSAQPLDQRRRERAAISGTVRDTEGATIAGALVCAAGDSSLLSAMDTRQPRCAETGTDGRYRIDDLFGVRQRVSAGGAGFLPADHVHIKQGLRRRAIDLRPGAEATDIDLTLERGGVEIRGIVEDLHGKPIAGAWLSSGGSASGTGIVWTRSGADGAYAMWVRPGTTTVTAYATGHAAGSATGPSEGHAFTVYLAPESVLRGKVFRAHDREPIEGARVRASAHGVAVSTDAAGHFHFDGLPPGVYSPRVETDDGFGMAAEQVSLGLGETSWPLMIAVQPAVFVEGRIAYENGEPCDNGALTLRESASGREIHDTTEPSGLVHLRGLLPGTYTATVTCKGAIPAQRYPLMVVRDKDVVDQVWQIASGRSISGVLVDASDMPVVGATIVARPDDGSLSPPSVVSDDAGRFLLRGLAAASYQVVPLAHPRRTMPDEPVAVDLREADVTDLRVPLTPTGEVRGTLRDAGDRPIAGAELALRTARGTQVAIAADDGRFWFASAAAGDSAFDVLLGGAPLKVLAHARVRVTADTTTTAMLVTTAPTGKITGVLSDTKGAPVADALVEVRPEGIDTMIDRPMLERVGGERPRRTDAAGHFELAGLPPAKYTVVAYRLGGGEARREHVTPGETLALALTPTGRVTGTVALHRGRTPEAFVVDLLDLRTGDRRSGDFVGTDGAWGFGNLPPGDYELRVRAREGEKKTTLTLAPGEERSRLRLELVGATMLRGTVLDLSGEPVPGLEVGTGSVRELAADVATITDAEGRFELPRVAVGPVFVTVGPPPGRPSPFGAARVPIEVQPDQKVVELAPIRVARRRIALGAARGDLGFTIVAGKADADPLLADLKVASVRPGGPAATAGLLPRDEIVTVDGQDVRGANRSLYATMSEVPPGTTLRLGLLRGAEVEVVASARR